MDNFIKIDANNLDVYVINLDSRPDRLKSIDEQFKKIGWKYTRYSAICNLKNFPSYGISKGAMGCIASHFDIIRQQMKKESEKLLVIIEDDALFCDDFLKRFEFIEKHFYIKDWDFFYLGGYYHLPSNVPKGWYNYDCKSRFLKDDKFQTYDLTSIKYIHYVHSLFTTHAYIVNPRSLKRIYNMMCQEVSKPHPKHQFRTRALDQIYQNLQEDEKLIAYTFTPGMVTQLVSKSDIVNLNVDYDTYHKKVCGEHIYSNNLDNFNYNEYFNICLGDKPDQNYDYLLDQIKDYLNKNSNIKQIIDCSHTYGEIVKSLDEYKIFIFESNNVRYQQTLKIIEGFKNITLLPFKISDNYYLESNSNIYYQNIALEDFNNLETLFISDVKLDVKNIIISKKI